MFMITNFFSVFIPFWGMLGLWTSRIGYHNRVCYLKKNKLTNTDWPQWEFYFYNVIFGLFQAPYYAVCYLFSSPYPGI